MKVTTKDGVVTAKAESLADVRALLQYVRERRPYVRTAPVTKKSGVVCGLCGKRFKYRKAHNKSCEGRGVVVPFIKNNQYSVSPKPGTDLGVYKSINL